MWGPGVCVGGGGVKSRASHILGPFHFQPLLFLFHNPAEIHGLASIPQVDSGHKNSLMVGALEN